MTSIPPAPTRNPPPAVAMPGRVVAVPEPDAPPEPTETETPDSGDASRDPRPFWRRVLVPLALWLIAIGLGVVAALLFLNRGETTTPDEVDTAIAETLSSTTIAPDRGPAIYGTIIQSVVFVQVGDPSAETGAIGTGVVVNEDGTILTSLHVVDSGEQIRVTFADGTQTTASIGGTQPENDIATLLPDQLCLLYTSPSPRDS